MDAAEAVGVDSGAGKQILRILPSPWQRGVTEVMAIGASGIELDTQCCRQPCSDNSCPYSTFNSQSIRRGLLFCDTL
jgi:hypothetical protein